jgi:hypothetical protein
MYFRPPIPISTLKTLTTVCCVFSIFSARAGAQTANPLSVQPVNRITTAVNDQRTVTLTGNHHPLAQAQNDVGV